MDRQKDMDDAEHLIHEIFLFFADEYFNFNDSQRKEVLQLHKRYINYFQQKNKRINEAIKGISNVH